MDTMPEMPAAVEFFIPTEIILQIVARVDRSLSGRERQKTLYNLCLVSHQWYSAALSFLYARPKLDGGNTYQRFTSVMCPPAGAPKKSKDLGLLVRRLDLSKLVHHSPNSMTARLINRVRWNLEVFLAPAAGFSVNCLSPLSKCTKMRYLDLSLVHEPFSIEQIRKTIRSMDRLISFRAPRFMRITREGLEKEGQLWPSKLETLQLSGTIDANMAIFPWPEHMSSLSLKHCMNLSYEIMPSILDKLSLESNLKWLSISTYNRGLQPECINLIPTFVPHLLFLGVPGDLVQDVFFTLIQRRQGDLALEVLEFGHTHTGDKLDLSTQCIIDTLHQGLPHLRAVGFHTMFGHYDDLDEALLEHAERKGDKLKISPETIEFEPGTYYFD